MKSRVIKVLLFASLVCFIFGGGASFAVTITPTNFPSGKVGKSYGSQSTTEIKLNGQITRATVTEGELPNGLEFKHDYYWRADYLAGTPVKSGTFTFTLRLEAGGESAKQSYSVTILKNSDIKQPSIDGTFSNGTIEDPYSSKIYASEGDSLTYEWDYSGTLPDGLGFQVTTNSEYELVGTPKTAGTYTFTVYLWDKYEPENGKASKTFTVTISDGSTPSTPSTPSSPSTPSTPSTPSSPSTPTTTSPLSITGSLIDGLVGIEYGSTTSGTTKDVYVMATGGTAPYDWRVEGDLPSNIKGYLSGTNNEYVVLKGTPATSDTYDFTFFVKDANNTETSKNFSITISEQTEEATTQYNNIVETYTDNKTIKVDVGGDSPTIVNVYKGTPSVNIEGDTTEVKTDTDRNTSVSLGAGGGGGGCEAGLGILGLAALAVMLTKRSR